MNKNRIQLIALDMDGTLLTTDKRVLSETIRDIEEAVQSGIHVAYCTGRAVAELSEFRETLSAMRYGACLCGAIVYDFKERRSIYKRPVGRQYINRIIASSQDFDAMVQLLTAEQSFVRSDQVGNMAEYNLAVYQDMFSSIATCVDSLEKGIPGNEPVLKANVHYHTPEDRQNGYEELKDLPLSFVFSEVSTLELMADGVSKASGLAMLAQCLGIPMDHVMGIGDGNNDREMLSRAGLSVAMGNARDEVKEICEAITADNDHNGVGQAIRRYCLSDEKETT